MSTKISVGDRVYVKAMPFRGHTGTVKEIHRLKSTVGLVRLFYVRTDELAAGHQLIKVTKRGLRPIDDS